MYTELARCAQVYAMHTSEHHAIIAHLVDSQLHFEVILLSIPGKILRDSYSEKDTVLT